MGQVSTDLALSLLDGEGRVTERLGPDERSVENVLRGLGFTTSDPGGYKDASFNLARRLDRGPLRELTNVRVYGGGNVTAWEGRLQDLPRHHGDEYTVNPGAVGHVARLDDDPSFAEIYVDADISGFTDPSVQRLGDVMGPGGARYSIDASQGMADTGTFGPGLVFKLGSAAAAMNEYGELFYYGGGVDIAKVLYDFRELSAWGKDAAWIDRMGLAQDDRLTGAVMGTNHEQQTTLGQSVASAASGLKYAVAQVIFTGAAVGDFTNTHAFTNVRVIGSHGLTLRGTGAEVGVYGSDVIADIVHRAAPDLRFTVGEGGSIEPSTFAIPHLVFKEGVKGSDAILATNAFHQRSWGVYEDKTFFWRPATAYRKRWRIRRSKGHGVDLLGPQAEDAINGVVCTFTDPGGTTRVVGPPGCPTAYATDARLGDTSPDNPVNAAGIPRKWAELKLDFITTTKGALEVSAAYLFDKLTTANARGSVVVTGLVEDDATGTLYPAWAMRAGDSAIVTDGDNVERGIIETSYDHDSRTTTANLDATPHKIDAMMERMGVVLTGVID